MQFFFREKREQRKKKTRRVMNLFWQGQIRAPTLFESCLFAFPFRDMAHRTVAVQHNF